MRKSVICFGLLVGANYSFGQVSISSSQKAVETVTITEIKPETSVVPAVNTVIISSEQVVKSTEPVPQPKTEEKGFPQPAIMSNQIKP